MAAQLPLPNVMGHADWGSKDSKRWCAKAILGADGQYTACAPFRVVSPGFLLTQLRQEAGGSGCVFVGFDFPIGVPEFYAKSAGVTGFRDWLPQLGKGKWEKFYSVCDKPEQISAHRPFYPDGGYKGRRKEELYRGHGVSSVGPLLRRCDRGGNDRKEACCLFWTLGSNQVGKAAISGWRDVLAPALRDRDHPVSLWPFDGALASLLRPGHIVVAETYPAECYGWFSKEPLGSKQKQENRAAFGELLLASAGANNVVVEEGLSKEMQHGFPDGQDDAFDAVVGLFGMLNVVLGQRAAGEPDDRIIWHIEGWILGRGDLRMPKLP